MSRPSRARSLVSWGVTAALILAGVLVCYNRTAIADDFRLINYTPPAAVAGLAQRIRFTGEGQRYFYVSHPSIEAKAPFNKACGSTEAHATVLGCYSNRLIYVYDVTDPRLAGVQEVTAAHETLHAAYARLSDTERTAVDGMLQRQYDALRTDAGFTERFAVYDTLSQADKLNELHSILGTEVRTLSGELETYYARYFKDRSVVAGYYTAYQGPFDALRKQQAALKAKITALETRTEASKKAYDADRRRLDADIQAFNQRANNSGYSSQREFDADRAALAARADALNGTAQAINAAVDEYNAAVGQYNALAIQTQDLQNSLSSQPVRQVPSV